MDFDAIFGYLNGLSITEGVWLFPGVFALHVLEEAPRFTAWVQRHASPRFTQVDFVRNNGLGMVLGVVLCIAVSLFPHPYTVFAFFVLGVWQAAFNTLFHVATTAAYGVYSPGLITSLTLYPTLLYYFSRLAFQAELLDMESALIAMLLGGVIHAYVVAVQVYFLKPLSWLAFARRAAV